MFESLGEIAVEETERTEPNSEQRNPFKLI